MKRLRLLDLFSGIGGFSLGLERSGAFRTVAFCDCEPFTHRVLKHHWPEVPIFDDVKTLNAERLKGGGVPGIDAICGGFPCQDISYAGPGEGLAGARSGLWFEFHRLIRELRPRFVFVENVSALLVRGLDAVLGSLAALGYDVWWDCIPASAVGAHHRRDRVWLVAYADAAERRPVREACRSLDRAQRLFERQEGASGSGGRRETMADAHRARCFQQWWPLAIRAELAAAQCGSGWPAEPEMGRMAHGVPDRVAKLAGLGNAVVPQIPEILGRAVGRFLLMIDAECVA